MVATQRTEWPWDDERPVALDLEPGGRAARLREMSWNRTHYQAVVRLPLTGCGEDTITGHARDFATLLEAGEPLIQPHELIVGLCLPLPEDKTLINPGYYNSHYPPGHETILRCGLPGMRDEALRRLEHETDAGKRDFLEGVAIAYEAACRYVARYAVYTAGLAANEADAGRRAELEEIAAVCEALTQGPPETFRAALQLVQFTRVFGGQGCIGRFDQWMWPYLRRDLEAGRMTLDEAQELLECFFVKLNAFGEGNSVIPGTGVPNDSLRNIALAGQTPAGEDACNPLSYMCLWASARLMMPEPKLNVRLFGGSPRRLLQECARVLAHGANTLAVFNDDVAIAGLERLGIPLEEARDYCNDGCSELIMGGRGTIWFRVYDSIMALRDAVLEAPAQPATFDELMADLKARLDRFMPDEAPELRGVTSPYFAASIGDCLEQASADAVRYRINGAILAQVGNTADGLAAIRKLVYDEGSLAWDDLVAAVRADFDGYAPMQQMILHRAPNYGNDEETVDELAREIAEYFCDGVHARVGHVNTPGPGDKWAAGLMCFGLEQKRNLPATPDGRRQGDPTANSFSPSPGRDRRGPTAVLRSAARVDLTRASHGSVLDVALHGSALRSDEDAEKLAALLDTFMRMPSTATLQLNVLDGETLRRAQENPTAPEYRTLLVRVWGFSAVFVDLPRALQDHVLARTAHGM
jgi:formate C-acetyltransferase